MTTGRINQVTILSQRTEMQRQTPREGRVLPSKKPPKRPKSLLYQGPRPKQRKRLIQLPPLSSSRAGPQRAMAGVSAVTRSVTCSPQEEKTYASSRVIRGNSARLSPKIWWIFGEASNPQTPNGARQNIDGASVPSPQQAQGHEGLLQYIGQSLPAQEQRVAEPLIARWEEQTSAATIEETRLAVKRQSLKALE
jgi:hypothetical protein